MAPRVRESWTSQVGNRPPKLVEMRDVARRRVASCAAASAPRYQISGLRLKHADLVLPNPGIPGDEGQPFQLRLGNQKPVEGVPVLHWQLSCVLGMMEGQRQVRKPPFLNRRHQVRRRSQATIFPLDRNFPRGHGANQNVVLRINDRGPSTLS